MQLKPIGYVRSPIADRKQMPPLGVPAEVEVLPEYAEGLLHIDKHSHLWILTWLHTATREPLQVNPRGAENAVHGVFALRSPTRPNPIGLTAVGVRWREGTRIGVSLLDFVDGTPVIDIKPYLATRDMIYGATSAQIGRPADREAIRASLLMQAEFFGLDIAAPAVEQAAAIVAHFRAEVLGFHDAPGIRVTAPEGRGDLADAFMAMVRVRPGNGSLRFHALPAVWMECAAGRAEYPV